MRELFKTKKLSFISQTLVYKFFEVRKGSEINVLNIFKFNRWKTVLYVSFRVVWYKLNRCFLECFIHEKSLTQATCFISRLTHSSQGLLLKWTVQFLYSAICCILKIQKIQTEMSESGLYVEFPRLKNSLQPVQFYSETTRHLHFR